MASSDETCGRDLREGERGYAVAGQVVCPACFEQRGDVPEYVEGPLPVDAICGRYLGPQPVPAPVATPEPQAAVSPLDVAAESDTEAYAAYVQGCLVEETMPDTFSAWHDAQRADGGGGDTRLAELLDATVRTVVSVVEAAYLLGKERGRGA